MDHRHEKNIQIATQREKYVSNTKDCFGDVKYRVRRAS